ncbi:MAG TPA: Gfo/Idh/MocA family oxidoreductase [bacterium]
MTGPVRFGLIGVGRWGKVYVKTLRAVGPEFARLTHAATSRPENAAALPEGVRVERDWRALLSAGCDALIIATPAPAHADIVEACVEAGMPCIVEKPLCLDVETAERVHARVTASGAPVLVNHTYLFNPGYVALRESVRRDGTPVRLILSEGVGLGPFRPETPAVWDWGAHDVSLCLDLMGRPPESVEALGLKPEGGAQAAEQACMRLGFSGGAQAWIHIGRLSPFDRRTFSVFTSRRLVAFDELDAKRVSAGPFAFDDRGSGAPAPRGPVALEPGRLPMEEMLRYFVRGLRGGPREHFGTALALDVTRVLARAEAALSSSSV